MTGLGIDILQEVKSIVGNGIYEIEVNWQDKDEAIKVVMDAEKDGKCKLGDIESFNRDGMRVTTIYLEDCEFSAWYEIERSMKEDGIRVL